MSISHLTADNPRLSHFATLWDSLPDSEQQLSQSLLESDQAHLFEDWEAGEEATAAQHAFLDRLVALDASYPGGLNCYISNARTLLSQAKQGLNPFEGYQPHQPHRVDLTQLDEHYSNYEALGMDNFDKVGVVLVAGGLGERLGYAGIKLDLPIETIETSSYLAHYAAVLKAMATRMPAANRHPVPFIIMTSEDTHRATLACLGENDYFGLQPSQVHLLKQELVPAISDNDGHLALKSRYQLQLKPHGHGDIHMLLHTSGLAEQLSNAGINHLLFIQDTNGQVFNAVPAALGVSVAKGYDFNSVAVNRIPGEAVGALARLVKGESELTINVEYNQLDPLLRATVSPEGDVPDANGFSIFPGNINVLVIRLDSYVKILQRTNGIIAEFVNPKYADATKTTFKKPTRLETMMQDLAKLFSADEKVGVSIFDRNWCFSAVKNNVAEAAVKFLAAGPPEAAATGESDFYASARTKLSTAGIAISPCEQELILGIPFTRGPKVILRPSFALTLKEVCNKVHSGSLSGEATLALEGEAIQLNNIALSGRTAVHIKACDGAHVQVDGLKIQNDGYELVLLSDAEIADAATPEFLRIRGYRFVDRGAKHFIFETPGNYRITANGEVEQM